MSTMVQAAPGAVATRRLSVSVVVPVYNEVENLPRLVEEIGAALSASGRESEVLLIDDGSTDGSVELLRTIPDKDPRFRVILFRRNFGQTAAMSAGFDHAHGDVVVAMDGDLQNDPAEIETLMAKIEGEGYDIVSGWRLHRKDKFLTRRLPSMIANRIIGKITGVRLHDYGCSLKAYRTEVLRNIRLYGEMHRFIPALASWVGARIAEVPVNHRPRTKGVSKYGLGRTVRVILDLITVKFLVSFSTRPLQVFGLWGLLLLGVGGGITAYLVVLRLLHQVELSRRPILTIAVFLALVGVQLISMGLLAEITIRTYHESQAKPTYVIRELVERRPAARG